ncbi:MAG: CAP domain-containing protein [Steroidobacter sp.]
MPRLVSQFCVMVVAVVAASPAAATILGALNAARQACGVEAHPLTLHRQLNAAARKVSEGMRPANAAHASGYDMTQLSSIHLQGFGDERELRSLLLQQSCNILGDADARDAGYYQHRDEVWILIGAARGHPGSAMHVEKRALLLVNEARARARRCGDKWFAAAPPLKLNSLLTRAAQLHSDEMARLRYLDHQGRDGSTPATRVSSTGYQWKIEGENVAAGAGNVDLAISDWLGSPHHCANIMDPRFTEMGIAFAINKDDEEYGVYWTQTFAAPKAFRSKRQ